MNSAVAVKNNMQGLKPVVDEDAANDYTIADTAAGVDVNVVRTTHCVVSVDAYAIRVTFSGVNPTATTGLYLPVGYVDVWTRELVEAAMFIRDTGNSGSLHISELSM